MGTIEQRVEKLEKLTYSGKGRITAILRLIIDNEKCVAAYRTAVPGSVRTEIIGEELELIKRDYEMRLEKGVNYGIA